MKQITLPNGLAIHALNQSEANALYCEIFDGQAYQKHGIRIANGSCVFDVGANIGLYSLFLAQSHPNLRVFAFEPIPAVFAVLQRNARQYYPHAQVLNVGLSNRTQTAQFTFKPGLSMMTSMYPEAIAESVQKQAGSYAWMQALLQDLERTAQIPVPIGRRLRGLLSRPYLRVPVLGVLLLPLLSLSVLHRFTTRKVTCSLKTLSQIIYEYGVEQIDVLKIDVEGCELDVIQGIDETDWSKIRQLVIEVHDIDNRVAALVDLLRRRGYRTTVEQQDWAILKLMNIYTLYAIADVPPCSPPTT